MRSSLMLIFMLSLGVLFANTAAADQAEDAKALVNKAVAMAEKDGVEKTLKAIGNRKGPFVKGDLYVWAGNFENTSVLAHPFIPGLVAAKGLKDFKDEKGNQVFVLCGKVAKDKGKGWTEYWHTNPNTGKVSPKKTYVSVIKGTKDYVACGYFAK